MIISVPKTFKNLARQNVNHRHQCNNDVILEFLKYYYRLAVFTIVSVVLINFAGE